MVLPQEIFFKKFVSSVMRFWISKSMAEQKHPIVEVT